MDLDEKISVIALAVVVVSGAILLIGSALSFFNPRAICNGSEMRS